MYNLCRSHFPPPPADTHRLTPFLHTHTHTDYLLLDKQLDELDTALASLEERRDKLHSEAQKLVKEAKEAREKREEEENKTNSSEQVEKSNK